jgi:hypothetical protein
MMKRTQNQTAARSPGTEGLHGDISREELAAVAYSIWENEGRPEGRAVEHWLQAEARLRLAHPANSGLGFERTEPPHRARQTLRRDMKGA